jgi:hypothetical protein
MMGTVAPRTPLTRLLALVALAVVAVVAAAGCGGDGASGTTVATREPTVPTEPPPSTTTTTVPEARKEVLVVGDSLTVGSLDFFTTAAAKAGFAFDVSAEIGREIPEGVEQLKQLSSGRRLVVIALGTNDATPGATDADLSARIDAALAAVPKTTPIVWVPPYRDPKTPAGKVADTFTGLLRQAAAKRGNVLVVDWVGFVKQDPAIIDKDRIHLTDAGYQKRADWLARVIRAQLDLQGAPAAG